MCCQGVLGGENQTDVATGQANPAQLQETIESLSPGSESIYNQESYQKQVNVHCQSAECFFVFFSVLCVCVYYIYITSSNTISVISAHQEKWDVLPIQV